VGVVVIPQYSQLQAPVPLNVIGELNCEAVALITPAEHVAAVVLPPELEKFVCLKVIVPDEEWE
jgi:hypothetical protein